MGKRPARKCPIGFELLDEHTEGSLQDGSRTQSDSK